MIPDDSRRANFPAMRKRTEESLRVLSGQLLHSKMRKDVALHTNSTTALDSCLAALRMNLAPLEPENGQIPPRVAMGIKESLSLIDELSNQLRTMSHLLHPPQLDRVRFCFNDSSNDSHEYCSAPTIENKL
jgi:hypothetical protein